MSAIHLAKGSLCPPIKDGVLRMYNMRYCPFAQRTLLVLKAKNVPFELVNINLKSKPDWFLARSKNTKVPVLEKNGEYLCQSLLTSDYLDEIYPDPPLYPPDLLKKFQERSLIQAISSKVANPLIRVLYNFHDENIKNSQFEKLSAGLSMYEKELIDRGYPFFGGESPGMLDYMMWPFIERFPLLEKIFQLDNLDFNKKYPALMEYASRMMKDPAVASTFISAPVHLEYAMSAATGTPNYDFELNLTSKL